MDFPYLALLLITGNINMIMEDEKRENRLQEIVKKIGIFQIYQFLVVETLYSVELSSLKFGLCSQHEFIWAFYLGELLLAR